MEITRGAGEIPASIGNLTSLTELDLSQNQLTGAYGVDPVLHLTSIQNRKPGAIPHSIGNLTDLRLQDNQLQGAYGVDPVLHLTPLTSKDCMISGAIPVHLLRMNAQDKNVTLPKRLTLPDNIGNLGEDVTKLDLSNMGLIGRSTPYSM
jgi:Leucine-rich repeat (LRR) protein